MELTILDTLQKGIEAHKTGKFKEAEHLYTSILKAQPKHPDANHNMGVLAFDVGKVQEALPFFQNALEATHVTAQFWISYIEALIRLDRLQHAKTILDQAKNKGATGQKFDALQNQLLEAETDKIPKDPPQGELQPLMRFYNEGQLEYVQSEATKMLKKYPNSASLFNILGVVCKSLGKLDEAFSYYQKAIKENPNYAEPHFNLANALHRAGNLEEAIAAHKRALTIKPDHAKALNNMGAILKEQQKMDEALEVFTRAVNFKPDYDTAWNNVGSVLQELGRLEEAKQAFKKTILLNPNYADAYYNLGNSLQEQGKWEDALYAFQRTVLLKPDYAEAYYNMGNTLKEQGKLDEAVIAYEKAQTLKPKFFNAFYNAGITLFQQGKLKEATEAFKHTIYLKPKYAEAFVNLGNVLMTQGKLKEAEATFKKAITLKPHYAEAHYNLGNALQEQEKLKAAAKAYNKAIALRPNYADAAWNLSGTANNVSEANKLINQCLLADKNHLKAKLTLSALNYYEGNRAEYDNVMHSSLKGHPYMRSFAWVFSLPKLPELYFHRLGFYDHITNLSKKTRPFYEFGVWRGASFKYLIKTFKKGYGFDTFDGIPDEWHENKSGSYSSEGNVPQVKGAKFVVGKFEDSLPEFFSQPRPLASLINFDADLYSSTICALNFSKPVIDKHTILIFDEFLMNQYWEQDEYKALNEFCLENNYTYEVLAISFFTKQAAVKLIST